MSRMDRYLNKEEKNELSEEDEVLSRTTKNEKIYDDVYSNSSVVDINNILEEDDSKKTIKEEVNIEPVVFEKKNYSVNDYIEKAHERLSPDNGVRSLNSQEFIEQENEISKLIAQINEKENDEEFFSNLIGENEDTMIEGQLNREDITYQETITQSFLSESFLEDEKKLDKALSNDTIRDLKLEEDGINNTFQDLMINNGLSNKKKKQISIIFFFITLIVLILVVLIIVFK